MTDLLWSTTILTAPPSAKNSRRLVTGKGKLGQTIPRIIKSSDALGWLDLAYHAFARAKPAMPFDCDLTLYVEAYYRTRKSDLSVELLMDALQGRWIGAGKPRVDAVIVNDRQIRRIIAEGFVDKDNPRCVVALAPHESAVSIPLRASVRRAA